MYFMYILFSSAQVLKSYICVHFLFSSPANKPYMHSCISFSSSTPVLKPCFLAFSLLQSRRSNHAFIYVLFFCTGAQTMHSCISSSSMPTLSITALSFSLLSGPAHHASPHPAEIALGTGISRPSACIFLHACSIAIASAVV